MTLELRTYAILMTSEKFEKNDIFTLESENIFFEKVLLQENPRNGNKISLQKSTELSKVKGNFSAERSCYVYRYSAKTSVQDVPLLPPSLMSSKSLLNQRRNSCPEVRPTGVVKFFHMISGEVESYPSIVYL